MNKFSKVVAVIQPYLAHYRRPIFYRLLNNTARDIQYTFYSGPNNKIGVNVIENPSDFNWNNISNYWFGNTILWQSKVIKLAFKPDIDVMIYAGSMYHISTWVSAIIAKRRGKRILMWTHGYVKREKNIKGWLREKFYQLSDGLLVYGHRAKNILMERGFDPSSIYVVYNSLDYEKQCSVRRELTSEKLCNIKSQLFSEPQNPVLLFIGRLTPQKKLEMIVQAAKVLADRNIVTNVLIVGEGPSRKHLQHLVGELHLGKHVKFIGECYREEELGPLISLAHVCVAPGEVGLTCIHAMAYGTPVITHDNPDHQMPEWEAIQSERTGLLFKEDCVQDLAKAIECCINMWRVSDLVRRNCKEIVDKYYNPEYQAKVINAAVCGLSSSDIEAISNEGSC